MRGDTLNAYVDGELGPEAHRAVQEAARADPALAARIATLTRLKGTARYALAPRPQHARPRSPRRSLAWGLSAAALCGLAVLLARPPAEPGDPAVAAFETWSDPSAGARPGLEPAAARGVPAPDLTGIGLTLIRQAETPQGRLTAYAGPHGCRLGLWVGEPAPGRTDPGEGLQTAGWTQGGRRFLVLSRGMDGRRFARIAAAIEGFTRARDPERLRLALDASGGGESRPCTG